MILGCWPEGISRSGFSALNDGANFYQNNDIVDSTINKKQNKIDL